VKSGAAALSCAPVGVCMRLAAVCESMHAACFKDGKLQSCSVSRSSSSRVSCSLN
jgi:hypothetical protein